MMMPPSVAQMPTLSTSGGARNPSPRHQSPHPGLHVDVPTTARAWHFNTGLAPHSRMITGPHGASLSAPTQGHGQVVVGPLAETTTIGQNSQTMATVPQMPAHGAPVPVQVEVKTLSHAPSLGQLSHGPPSQVKLEQLPVQIATEEMGSGRTANWVQRPAGGDALSRQPSCNNLSRIPSASPSRSDLLRQGSPAQTTEKPGNTMQVSTLSLEVASEVLRGQEVASKTVETKLDSVVNEIRELKIMQSKAYQGKDTSEQVLAALREAETAGSLRCALKRAEETNIPEADLQMYKEQLPTLERAEQDKAAFEERKRAQEKKQMEDQFAAEKKDKDRKIQEVTTELGRYRNEVTKLNTKVSQADLEKKQLMEQLSSLETRYEKEIGELKVKNDTMRTVCEKKSSDCNEMKKQIAQLQDENKEARTQISALRSREQQSANREKTLKAECEAEIERMRQQCEAQLAQQRAQSETTIVQLGTQAETLRNEKVALSKENHKMREEVNTGSAKLQQLLSSSEQENVNVKQRLNKVEALNGNYNNKLYEMEVGLRKAQLSSSASPEEILRMGKAQKDANLPRRLADMQRKYDDANTKAEQLEARYAVLWEFIPDDKEVQGRLQNKLHEAMQKIAT